MNDDFSMTYHFEIYLVIVLHDLYLSCLLSQWISNHGFGTISNSRCYGRILTPWLNDTVFTTDRGAGNQANLPICFRAVGIFLTDIDTPLSYRNFNLIKGPSIY